MTTYHGRCHCGAIRFEAEGDLERVLVCNCSICTQKGYLHWMVAQDRFRLLTAWDAIAEYRFGTKQAKHYFCKTCGVSPFYVARSDPDKIDVNVRCLEGVALDELALETFDGQNWDQAFERYRR